MTKEQKKFLMVTLPKFIVREQGRGFGMDGWMLHDSPGQVARFDHTDRIIPKCGTVACIGGSTEHLLKLECNGSFSSVADALGLDYEVAHGLCYGWEPSNKEEVFSWPPKFAEAYAKAKTPLAKAKIAADLCKLVGKTEGKCLHR